MRTTFVPGDVHVGQHVLRRTLPITVEDLERYKNGTDSHDLTGSDVPALLHHSEVYRDLTWYLPNLIGNLHARQEVEVFAPQRVGDTVVSTVTVVDRYRKRNREYVVAEVLWTDSDGRWLQRTRTHQSFLADLPAEGMVVDKDRERRDDRRSGPPTGDGERFGPRTRTITHAMCTAFSGPTRNYHTDVEMARALGFPDIVVQGMMSVCFVADLMAERFGDGWHHGGKLDVKLVNVVWPKDVVESHGLVQAIVPEGKYRRAHCDVWCAKPDGTMTIVGTASALV